MKPNGGKPEDGGLKIRVLLKVGDDILADIELSAGSGSDCIIDDGESELLRVYESGGSILLEDPARTGGLLLNNKEAVAPAVLRDGDIIRIPDLDPIDVLIFADGGASLDFPPLSVRGRVRSRRFAIAAVCLCVVALAGIAFFYLERPSSRAEPAMVLPSLPEEPAPAATVVPEWRFTMPDAPAPPAVRRPPAPLRADEWSVHLEAEIGCLGWQSATEMLLAGLGSGEVLRINPRNGGVSDVIQVHRDSVSAIAVAPDGRSFLTASYDGSLKFFSDIDDPDPILLRGHAGEVRAAAIHPEGFLAASGGADGFVMLWDLRTAGEPRWLLGHISMVNSVVFSPDGGRLFSAGQDGTILVWDTDTASKVTTLPGPQTGVNSLAMHPDGTRLASGADGFLSSIDGIYFTPGQTVRQWSAETLDELPFESEVEAWILSVAFSPDGRILWAATGGHPAAIPDSPLVPTVLAINAATGEVITSRAGPMHAVTALVVHPDGASIFAGGLDRALRRLNTPETPD